MHRSGPNVNYNITKPAYLAGFLLQFWPFFGNVDVIFSHVMPKKIYFFNSKGQKLCGILEEPNPSKKEVVIIVHGFSSSKNRPTPLLLAEELAKRGINSFRIDLDGCGESEGKFEEQTITSAVDDTNSAIDYVKKVGFTGISLFGSSAGGLTVMATALKHPEIKRIALKAPVSDYVAQRIVRMGEVGIEEWRKNGLAEYITGGGKKFILPYSLFEDFKKYIMYDKVKDIRCPTLIIHGDADVVVDIEQSKKVSKNFPNYKLMVLPGANHQLLIDGDMSLSVKLFGDWFEFGDASL